MDGRRDRPEEFRQKYGGVREEVQRVIGHLSELFTVILPALHATDDDVFEWGLRLSTHVRGLRINMMSVSTGGTVRVEFEREKR
jgi:hypothetical protein